VSEEDLEGLVRRGWDAYNRGDIDGTVAILSPEVVVHTAPPMANAGTYHGVEGFVTWITQWSEAWDSFRADVVEVETVGDRHVVTHVHQSGVGRGSGIEVSMDSGWVFDVRDGLCVYLGLHPSVEQARTEALARETSG
jgi:ketosteroid isomerase-like protein